MTNRLGVTHMTKYICNHNKVKQVQLRIEKMHFQLTGF